VEQPAVNLQPVEASPATFDAAEDAPLDLTEAQVDASDAADDDAEELVLTAPDVAGEELLLDDNVDAVDAPEPDVLPLTAEEVVDDQSQPSWLSGADAAPEKSDDAPSPPRIAPLGATLFERMSSIARGASRSDEEAKPESSDIPRFLNRQNNQ
jgi:cell division protein FtsZ